MQQLYDMVFKTQDDRRDLYYKTSGTIGCNSDGELQLPAGTTVDLLTYFNCFSIIKWKQYTTINKLIISGVIEGKANVSIFSIGESGKELAKLNVSNAFSYCFNINDLDGEILGIEIEAVTNCCTKRITYNGCFGNWRELKVGVSICTFKREEYVNKTIKKLVRFSRYHPWLSTLVVDNGSSLNECNYKSLRIIHNPNYGGSGGFTRGLLENLRIRQNDYVLLMDDDIDLDSTVLNHMYGLLCGLKEEYRESFLSGAMLHMDNPCIQHENTAYWGKIKHHSLGHDWDLSKQDVLIKNESIKEYKNHYGAWWFCCIPLKRVKKIGLPLPVFIKGDDIEYGIRNQRKLIHMNGIGVWHETLDNKRALWVNYFEYRNFFILNQYVKGCNRWTLLFGICGRMVDQFIKGCFDNTKILEIAIEDALQGFENITAIPANEHLEYVRKLKVSEKYYVVAALSVLYKGMYSLFAYDRINKRYLTFREKELMSEFFWWDYLSKGKIN